jgi:hypothetical protein
MMLLHSPAAVAVTVAVALLLAGWTLAAGWAVLAARARVRRAEAAERLARKLTRMVDEAPALPCWCGPMGGSKAPRGWPAGWAWMPCPVTSPSWTAAVAG